MIYTRFALVLLAALCGADLPATAQSSAALPTCAAGDVVVWENTLTKAYHLAGDRYYGHTTHGTYACRSAADSGGYHLAGKGAKSHAMPSAMGSPDPQATASPAMGRKHHRGSAMASPTPAPAAT